MVGVAGVCGRAGGVALGCPPPPPPGTKTFALGLKLNSLALGFRVDFLAIEAASFFAGSSADLGSLPSDVADSSCAGAAAETCGMPSSLLPDGVVAALAFDSSEDGAI